MPSSKEFKHTHTSSHNKNIKQTRRKLIFLYIYKMSIERLLSSPAWRGLQLLLGLLQVFFSRPLSIQNANAAAAQPLSQLNEGFVLVPAASGEKVCGSGFCDFFFFLLFAPGVFLGYVNIGEEMIWDLRKGVGEREFWGCGFKAGCSVPCRTHYLNKAPLFRERTIL